MPFPLVYEKWASFFPSWHLEANGIMGGEGGVGWGGGAGWRERVLLKGYGKVL